jgi:hypothetical protein
LTWSRKGKQIRGRANRAKYQLEKEVVVSGSRQKIYIIAEEFKLNFLLDFNRRLETVYI